MTLKDMRRAKGWSQDQLAEISGVSVRTIQRLEKGELPALETQKALAAAFGVTIEEFASQVGEESALPAAKPKTAVVRLGWIGLLGHVGIMMVGVTWLFFLNREFGVDRETINFVAYMWGFALVAHAVHLAMDKE